MIDRRAIIPSSIEFTAVTIRSPSDDLETCRHVFSQELDLIPMVLVCFLAISDLIQMQARHVGMIVLAVLIPIISES